MLRSLAIYRNPVALRKWRKHYRQFLEPGDLVFDIGAHAGNRTRAMHDVGAKVVAIEPQADFAKLLRRTLPRDVTVIEAAVSNVSGQGTLCVSSRHPTVTTLSADFVRNGQSAAGFERVTWDVFQTVRVTTLDAVIADYGFPKYVKIDVEGAELEVLKGLSSAVSLISVEYLPAFPSLARELVGHLGATGYSQFNVVEGESGEFRWQTWQAAEIVDAWLSSLEPQAKSGDLFAKLDVLPPRLGTQG